MDLPRDLQDMIDEYVSDAFDATGTRKSRQVRRLPTPLPIADVEIDVSDMSADDAAAAEPSDGLIPVEIDDRTDPEGRNIFSFDEGTAFLAPAFIAPKDPIPSLSRIRTARGSHPPPAEIELDEDEITNVLGIPPQNRG
ncbi:MAG TPA: hypothetical protein VL326_03105 [Kofleriaceae bacterium]|jgi:hypothetical protein|nr:hypothetical protein [Kofleriaceae bacterium]